jgi:hypothetical protein
MTASIKRTCESLVAGSIIYAAMAACSGGGGAIAGGQMSGHGGSDAAIGGQPAAVAGSTSTAGTVPVAMAAGTGGSTGTTECDCQPVVPVEPTVIEVPCDVTVDGSPALWAVAEFPGKTALELSAVRVLVEYPEGINKWPAGFSSIAGAVYVKDGSVATTCGIAQAPDGAAVSVRFILQ